MGWGNQKKSPRNGSLVNGQKWEEAGGHVAVNRDKNIKKGGEITSLQKVEYRGKNRGSTWTERK